MEPLYVRCSFPDAARSSLGNISKQLKILEGILFVASSDEWKSFFAVYDPYMRKCWKWDKLRKRMNASSINTSFFAEKDYVYCVSVIKFKCNFVFDGFGSAGVHIHIQYLYLCKDIVIHVYIHIVYIYIVIHIVYIYSYIYIHSIYSYI